MYTCTRTRLSDQDCIQETTIINDTLLKFGFPDSSIHRYKYWSVLLRPQQITLGSLVIAAHSHVTQLSDLEVEAITELSQVTADIEGTLKSCFQHDKINYLMLMMVDPHVHVHVIPRYQSTRVFQDVTFTDDDWPLPPDLTRQVEQNEVLQAQLLQYLTKSWKN